MKIYAQRVAELVTAQQKEYAAGTLEYGVGELLKDMADLDPAAAGLLASDLEREGMGIEAAGKHLMDHAKKNKKGSAYAMTDAEARTLLRTFYHIPEDIPAAAGPSHRAPTAINLLDFL